MSNVDLSAPETPRLTCRVSARMTFVVSLAAELVVQVATSRSAGAADDEQLEVTADDRPPLSIDEIHDQDGATLHVIRSAPGRLTVDYRAKVRLGTRPGSPSPDGTPDGGTPSYERHTFLRPSRYCPSDHLIGFAVAEFGVGQDVDARIAAITRWIRRRIDYVSGSGSVHDSAEHTLLTGRGSCRDFAHLGVALCRAIGVPARFAAVYLPGLAPMDFHAVFETLTGDRWLVHDPTGLAPRQSLVRIATGRDAADTAFAAVNSGIADLEDIEVSAVAEPDLPKDDPSADVQLA